MTRRFLFLCVSVNLFSAAPLMHTFLAEKWLDAHQIIDREQRMQFLIGTLFPDIRYLGVISREMTHEPDMTLHKVDEKTSFFEKGKAFHAFVDDMRESYVVAWNIYSLFPSIPPSHRASFLKLVEDAVLYETYQPVDIDFALLPEELLYGISQDHLTQWHALLRYYFWLSPAYSIDLTHYFSYFCCLDGEGISTYHRHLSSFTQDPSLRTYVNLLIQTFAAQIETPLESTKYH